MLTLYRRPRDQWKTATLAEGVEIGVRVERPSYEQLLASQTSPSSVERIAIRLETITDWRDVVDAEGKPIPFSRDAFGDLLHAFPDAAGRLLIAIRPFFEAEETARKNSEPPPSAAIPAPPPSAASDISADSPPSPMPPD